MEFGGKVQSKACHHTERPKRLVVARGAVLNPSAFEVVFTAQPRFPECWEGCEQSTKVRIGHLRLIQPDVQATEPGNRHGDAWKTRCKTR